MGVTLVSFARFQEYDTDAKRLSARNFRSTHPLQRSPVELECLHVVGFDESLFGYHDTLLKTTSRIKRFAGGP